jgi:hypothetical protein
MTGSGRCKLDDTIIQTMRGSQFETEACPNIIRFKIYRGDILRQEESINKVGSPDAYVLFGIHLKHLVLGYLLNQTFLVENISISVILI